MRRRPESQANYFAKAVEGWVRRQRWFPRTTSPLSADALWELRPDVYILVMRAGDDGPLLQVPLVVAQKKSERDRDSVGNSVPVGELSDALLFDGTALAEFWQAWAAVAEVTRGTRDGLLKSASKVRPLGVEQSNTSVLLLGSEDPLLAKAFRVLHAGAHPEVEIPSALTNDNWPGVAPVWAYWDLPQENAEGLCSAVVSTAVQEAADGFDYFVEMATQGKDPSATAETLGSLIGSLHNRLADLLGESEPPSVGEVRSQLEDALSDAAQHGLSSDEADAVKHHLCANGLLPDSLETKPIRIHGDLHLGQLLRSGQGQWVVVDFEGEPLRDLAARRRPALPMRDVAGMLRSFDYAAVAGRAEDPMWARSAREAFLRGYDTSRLLTEEDRAVLDALELEKALYEVSYEGRFRPDRLPIPLEAVRRIVNPL